MLLEWAENELKPKAKLAFEGKGETVPGPWCTFCKVKTVCRARTEANLNLYNRYNTNPNLLSAEEIAEVLKEIDDVQKWARELKDFALEEALKGTKYPGFKLVEGRSNRVIENEEEFAKVLINEGYNEEQIYKPQTLQGITVLEKIIGKKRLAEIGEGFIIKPPGKPTLVPESDKRPELGSVEDEFF